jgi:hypothetical protein
MGAGPASGFDKGTLAMAHIGLARAGRSKPARVANKLRAVAPYQIPSLRRHIG